MAGRQAELRMFQKRTTGASNDIERASNIATAMVKTYGMSDEIGPRKLGAEFEASASMSPTLLESADNKITAILDKATKDADQTIQDHYDAFERVAEALIEFETIDRPEFLGLVEGKPGIMDKIREARAIRMEEVTTHTVPPNNPPASPSATLPISGISATTRNQAPSDLYKFR